MKNVEAKWNDAFPYCKQRKWRRKSF